MSAIALTALEPRWYTDIARPAVPIVFHCGITFLCPHCRTERLAVPFENPIDPYRLQDQGILWTRPKVSWRRTGESFETLTLNPSIDASNSGHWHGYLVGGFIEIHNGTVLT